MPKAVNIHHRIINSDVKRRGEVTAALFWGQKIVIPASFGVRLSCLRKPVGRSVNLEPCHGCEGDRPISFTSAQAVASDFHFLAIVTADLENGLSINTSQSLHDSTSFASVCS